MICMQVCCSRKNTNGCEWKGKLLNLACHEDDQNECPYQPVNIKQMIHNMEERRKRDLKILILVLSIMAVGLSLLFQFMTTTCTTAKTMEQSLISLKQEMNIELTTAMKETEKSLMSLKLEMNGEFSTMTKEMEEKIYKGIYSGLGMFSKFYNGMKLVESH